MSPMYQQAQQSAPAMSDPCFFEESGESLGDAILLMVAAIEAGDPAKALDVARAAIADNSWPQHDANGLPRAPVDDSILSPHTIAREALRMLHQELRWKGAGEDGTVQFRLPRNYIKGA